MINVMEVVRKEDDKRNGVPNFSRDLYKRGLYKMIEDRSNEYPTLSICDECVEDCRQVEVVGLFRFFCGIKNKVWRK